jgi:hypothetical protein
MVHKVGGSTVLAAAHIGGSGGSAARKSARRVRCIMEVGRKYLTLASGRHEHACGGHILSEQCRTVRDTVVVHASVLVQLGQRNQGVMPHHGWNALARARVQVRDGYFGQVG